MLNMCKNSAQSVSKNCVKVSKLSTFTHLTSYQKYQKKTYNNLVHTNTTSLSTTKNNNLTDTNNYLYTLSTEPTITTTNIYKRS